MNCWTSSEGCGVRCRDQGKHNGRLKVVEGRGLPDMFPRVSGKLEQVCMCLRKVL